MPWNNGDRRDSEQGKKDEKGVKDNYWGKEEVTGVKEERSKTRWTCKAWQKRVRKRDNI